MSSTISIRQLTCLTAFREAEYEKLNSVSILSKVRPQRGYRKFTRFYRDMACMISVVATVNVLCLFSCLYSIRSIVGMDINIESGRCTCINRIVIEIRQTYKYLYVRSMYGLCWGLDWLVVPSISRLACSQFTAFRCHKTRHHLSYCSADQ